MAAIAWSYRPQYPRKCPGECEKVLNIVGDEFPGQIGIAVIDDRRPADLRAEELGMAVSTVASLGVRHGDRAIKTVALRIIQLR